MQSTLTMPSSPRLLVASEASSCMKRATSGTDNSWAARLGRLVCEGFTLATSRLNADLTLPPDGEEMSGARRAIETIENVFRHSLGTCFTSVTQPRSQMLRVGHASHRDDGGSARRRRKTA